MEFFSTVKLSNQFTQISELLAEMELLVCRKSKCQSDIALEPLRMTKLLIAKQIRFATRREGGEQWSWHRANEQRSRPINAVRRPDLFGYSLWII